ncbi:hypothetical protein EAV90_02565 [Bradyrhizobium vignae]|nr:hypothetical protein EAV90_02565 [Bradyrhizobium vignae]
MLFFFSETPLPPDRRRVHRLYRPDENPAARCIAVHHNAVQSEGMAEGHKPTLDDLQCLCANCHRVAHRLLKLELDQQGSAAKKRTRTVHGTLH